MTSPSPTRILLVGSTEIVETVANALSGCSRNHALDVTPSAAEALARLRRERFDVLVADYVREDTDGFVLLRQARDVQPHLIAISLLHVEDGPRALAALKAGADHVIDPDAARESLGALLERRLIGAAPHDATGDQDRQSEHILTALDAVFGTISGDGILTSIRGPVSHLLGVAPEQLIGRRLTELPYPHVGRGHVTEAFEDVQRTGRAVSVVIPRSGPDGRLSWFRTRFAPYGDVGSGNIAFVAQDVTDQVQSQQVLDRRNEELDCLYAITRAVQGKLNARGVIQAAAEVLAGSFLADSLAVAMVSEDGRRVEETAVAGFSDEFVRVMGRSPSGLLTDHAFARAAGGAGALVADPETMGELITHSDLVLNEGLRFALCVPGRRSARLSALVILLRRDLPYDDREQAVAQSVASCVANAIESARAHDRVAQALQTSTRLLEVGLAINAQEALDGVLRAVASAAAELPGALAAAVCLRDELNGTIEHCYPATAQDRAPRRWAFEPFAERAMRERRSIFSHPDDASWPHGDAVGGLRSVVALPLIHGSKVLGALVVARRTRQQPDRQDRLALELLGSEAAVAVYNHRLLAQVRQSQALYRDLFELSGVPMVVYRFDGTIEMINRAFEELSGYRRDELIEQRSIFELIDPRDHDRVRRLHELYWSGRRKLGREAEFRGTRKDGTTRYVRASLHRVPNREAVTAVLIDNTEALRLQRQLIQSEKAAALGQLVSGVAHELNNPLTSILGYAELLQDAGADETVVEHAAVIQREAQRSQRIIEGLLSFARERPPQFAPTDVNAAIEEALRMPAYRMKVDNIEVVTDLAPDLPLIEADSHQLQQVFLNIINNAHFAMRDTGGRLRVSSRLVSKAIDVTITDTGPGMSEEQVRRAFDPFYTTKSVNEGTGLGLSVSLGIVRRHGGEIVLNSAPGEGTTVVVRLPARTARSTAPEGPPVTVVAARNARVLVVDDEEPLLDLVRQALGSMGHEVHTAQDASAGLRLLEENEYDVILSDLRMPGMDGEEFHQRVAERWPHMASRFVIVTGDTIAAETGRLLGRPAIRALCKPFTIAQLRETVAQIVEEHTE